MVKSVRKYGKHPFRVALLHGGPGASGEMQPVAKELGKDFGVLELLQTKKTITGQIEEFHRQLTESADLPVILIGHSWGAWLGFLFASRYPEFVSKLILIGAGAFESQYNHDLMNIRLSRLSERNRKKAERLIYEIESGSIDKEVLKAFGHLMTRADSYDYDKNVQDTVDLDMEIYQSVWPEASKLRNSNELVRFADGIRCPVVAIHGEYDSHPADGVEKPLSERLPHFKMIRLEKCGHVPWKERQATNKFFQILKEEIMQKR
ncbi:alpha/beta fold hydrolase [Anaerophaga thermohalophila]|jgi:pimeloyl-ACP methyl ester carboxylesterase|uniref:alpha/beta fold hydrolase n=1 Tax=Anaerophaga thermohalophila TaxID=177400 RepID=UPI00031CBC1C|nr:alpha/beta hydrolase [Anaerophaga thermohalophila]